MVNGGDQSKAFREAFPQSRRWKPETVWSKASTLFRQRKVQQRVQELRKLTAEQAIITDTELLREVAHIALSDIRDYHDDAGQLLPLQMLSDRAAAAVASIQYETVPVLSRAGYPTGEMVTRPKRLALWNKLNAQEKLFKHLGLYLADNQQKASFEQSGFAQLPREIRDLFMEHVRDIVRQAGLSIGRGPDGRPAVTGQPDALPGRPASN